MPEGHTVHRSAALLADLFAGTEVSASSPQGRFADGAALLDGRVLERTEAVGKHLLGDFGDGRLLHVHLGLYGKWAAGRGEPPEVKGALRLRLRNDEAWADLRGPTACEVVDPAARTALLARLGPDPLRTDADPERMWRALSRSGSSIGGLLMDQTVVAGIGNVYRAEVLFRSGIDPAMPGKLLSRTAFDVLWLDLRALLRAGVRAGRIVTTRPEHRSRRGRATLADAHYVYRRTGLPCRICGTPVQTRELLSRNLYWCPTCQSGDPTGGVLA
ncbi:endonuclease-8/formamidopyrimidine-DNA glycosylase [Motilibacter rhizosphaerae]|uniref:DNA-(apurinic or apyrimidinic site) lyase n=1 Tax=Motilibacter rhizosphaerae TaxID=598652 RepID=A0A4Q7NRU0_9ACTN|nr:DNA-formamidopyrimidine glycosylase family protein [Motilibacter rhizosphaerae]RZS89806.1 endonuclease-8/formamidopyrimidine-DNA glycosylase [Motilibacter rhizosphaerae]